VSGPPEGGHYVLDSSASLLQEFGDERRPSGLMARAKSDTSVTVEVFVKEERVIPLGTALVDAVHGTRAVGTFQEQVCEPARQFGGNSNWRGPIWFPVNYLLIESLQKFHYFLGDDYTVECPTGSSRTIPLNEVAAECHGVSPTSFSATKPGGAPSSEAPLSSRKIPSGETRFPSTNTSMETTAPASARVTKRAGRDWWRS